MIESKREIKDLELIKKFKDSVLNCVNLMAKFELVKFFDSVKNKLSAKAIDLNVCTEILNFGMMMGECVGELTAVINSTNPYLYKRVLILTIGHLMVKLFNIEDKEKRANSIMARVYKQVPNGSERLLSIIALKLDSHLKSGQRYESSEVDTLINNLSLMFKAAFYQPKCIERLNELDILKWASILRIEQIKYELNTDDFQIVSDLRSIENHRGIQITQRLIQIIKSVKIEDLLLKFVVTKFRKNEWDLNDQVLNLIETSNNTSEWIEMIKKFDLESKSKALTRAELIDEMKRLEATGEINSYVKKLIERNETGKCIIELCLDKLDTVHKNSSNLFFNMKKKIEEYEKSEISEWTKLYKQEKKNNLESLNCVHVVELVAVLCRSVELVYKYKARDVQKIALLLFMDSIVFNFSGRLANISTGEGKSLITIWTSIAYILIKGGNVDILTSSEILAERDSLESTEMFAMFDIIVTNNCDSLANADENVRKQRYSNSMVVKYFEKEIRTDLAGCLIIDEVDSMCIDNICNTLYISHQIADLTYMKHFYCLIWHAVNNQDTQEYTEENVQKVKTYVQSLMDGSYFNYPSNLQDFVNRRLEVWINNAYVAKHHAEEGNHYSLLSMGKKSGEAVINDLQTGVEQLNTQWSDGNIYGMTGTLGASIERDLLAKAYDLDFFQLPRFKKELNVKQDDWLVANKCQWLEKINHDVDLHVSENRVVSIDEQNQAKKNLTIEGDLLALEQQLKSKKLELQDLNDTCGEMAEADRNRGGGQEPRRTLCTHYMREQKSCA
ncbi:translocase subunit seca [Brachionus plicatilis]|uniref:Translocase subunit seca n=1 Tax=Brachionus plicatilis TaxID=10195 RepID=A0A3M7RK84_BRAPC|nr:translocase subunit seca [Brachionus plicatilis]